jgi:hypothetical protein
VTVKDAATNARMVNILRETLAARPAAAIAALRYG